MPVFSLLLVSTLPVVSAQTSQLAATPTSGNPGTEVSLRGEVPAGQTELRSYWEQYGELRLMARATAAANGTFLHRVAVPANARPGLGRWGMLPAGRPAAELAYTDFEVLTPAPGRLLGTVRKADGGAAGPGFTCACSISRVCTWEKPRPTSTGVSSFPNCRRADT